MLSNSITRPGTHYMFSLHRSNISIICIKAIGEGAKLIRKARCSTEYARILIGSSAQGCNFTGP